MTDVRHECTTLVQVAYSKALLQFYNACDPRHLDEITNSDKIKPGYTSLCLKEKHKTRHECPMWQFTSNCKRKWSMKSIYTVYFNTKGVIQQKSCRHDLAPEAGSYTW